MNKCEFLRELKNSLEGHLSNTDLEEILSDYGDIFDNGFLEGKSEKDISEEIGSPAAISRTILDDIGNNHSFNSEPISTDISNLAPMSKRLGAYIIDTFIIALFFSIILFVSTFSFHETTKTTEIIENSNISSLKDTYSRHITLDKNGEAKKIELFKDDRRVFKGTNEEFIAYMSENNIFYDSIISTETSSPMSMNSMSFFTFIPMTMVSIMFMLLGFSGLITAFELWIFKGYTLGKWIVKIKVVPLKGDKLTFLDVLLRDALIKFIGNGITSGILNIFSFIWGCGTPEHKTVHDLAARTKVIDVVR